MISRPNRPTSTATGPAGDPAERGEPVDGACPKCGTELPGETVWCPGCGLQVADPCWECGVPLSAGAKWCARCGTPNTEPAVVECPHCSLAVRQGLNYCPRCGTQARRLCLECERPLRRDWMHCPACGAEASGEQPEPEPEDVESIQPVWIPPAPAGNPREAERLNRAATQAYERGKTSEAVRLFSQATEQDPQNATYWTNLGVALGEAENEAEAVKAFRRALELNPQEVSAYLNLGFFYSERERRAEAREMWEKVIELAPDSDEAAEARENLNHMEQV